jgi:anti-anti-sigma factor
MAVIFEVRNALGIITPSGPLDAAAVESFHTQMAAWWDANVQVAHVVVDLDQVGFMDSSGLGALIGLARRTASRDGSVRLARPRDSVKLVLDITRASRLFPVHADLEQAVAAVQTGGSTV